MDLKYKLAREAGRVRRWAGRGRVRHSGKHCQDLGRGSGVVTGPTLEEPGMDWRDTPEEKV